MDANNDPQQDRPDRDATKGRRHVRLLGEDAHWRSGWPINRHACLWAMSAEPAGPNLELTQFPGHLIRGVVPGKEARMGRPAKYPDYFRREAVALCRSSDGSRAKVAKSLGISDAADPHR